MLFNIIQSIKESRFVRWISPYIAEFYYRLTKKYGLIRDARRDMRICGIDMTKYVPAIDRDGKGTTGTESTPYCALERMYEEAIFSRNDRLIDVGCGYGRVLAFLEDIGFPGQLYGVELNPKVSKQCSLWIGRYGNIHLIEGDAFDLNYDNFTVLNMSRPMMPGFFQDFICKVEREVTHPIRLFYFWDSETGNFMDGRPGWELIKREKVRTLNGIPISRHPQRYSVWKYTPVRIPVKVTRR